MPRDRKSVEKTLRAKGFAQIEDDHHDFIYITREGRRTRARSKTNHSPKVKDLADNLIGKMARQCLLAKPEFLRLVDCPMSRDDYERVLSEQGEL